NSERLRIAASGLVNEVMNWNAASGFLLVLRITALCCTKLPVPFSGYGPIAHLSTTFDLEGSCRLGTMKDAQPSSTATSPLRNAFDASGLSQARMPGGLYLAMWSFSIVRALRPLSLLMSGCQSG